MNAKMHLPDTLGPGLVTGLDVAMLVKGKTGFHSIAQCNTPMLDSLRQLESVNQTYSTAIGTHMARPAISTSPSSTVKQWWRSMCASMADRVTMLSGAITCSNIVGELWRKPMFTSNAISRLSHTRNGISSSSAARNAYSLLDWGPRFLSKNAQPFHSH